MLLLTVLCEDKADVWLVKQGSLNYRIAHSVSPIFVQGCWLMQLKIKIRKNLVTSSGVIQ